MKSTLFFVFLLFTTVFIINAYQFKGIRFTKKKVNSQQIVADPCNITHFEFQNNVSLAKSDQLNRTFTQIGSKITALNNVTWKKNSSATYLIYEANPTFYYRDSKQKAEIVGNDTIVIDGGFLEVSIDFKFTIIGSITKYGVGSVKGLSDQVAFAKDIIIDGNFFRFDLLDYFNITFDTPMSFTRYSPADLSKEEQTDVLSLVNNIANVTTLRHELENDIALYYAFYLKMNLHDETHPIDKTFSYTWKSPIPSKADLVIPFTRIPAFIDIERDGMHYGYEARIDNYANWTCGAMPPVVPMSSRVYGGSQQFISWSFYENVLRYAIGKGAIDTDLTRQNWESRMFQFYAGDLYEIFPKVAQTYPARTEVTGICKANASQLKVFQNSGDTFNATIHFNCELNVNRTKILDFRVGIDFELRGKASFNSMDIVLVNHKQYAFYTEVSGWKMENPLLADQLIHHSLNRLYEGKIFGSNWPLHPQRDYPHFLSEITSSFVYDSTHVQTSTI